MLQHFPLSIFTTDWTILKAQCWSTSNLLLFVSALRYGKLNSYGPVQDKYLYIIFLKSQIYKFKKWKIYCVYRHIQYISWEPDISDGSHKHKLECKWFKSHPHMHESAFNMILNVTTSQQSHLAPLVIPTHKNIFNCTSLILLFHRTACKYALRRTSRSKHSLLLRDTKRGAARWRSLFFWWQVVTSQFKLEWAAENMIGWGNWGRILWEKQKHITVCFASKPELQGCWWTCRCGCSSCPDTAWAAGSPVSDCSICGQISGRLWTHHSAFVRA